MQARVVNFRRITFTGDPAECLPCGDLKPDITVLGHCWTKEMMLELRDTLNVSGSGSASAS
jgi:hypothetical protein